MSNDKKRSELSYFWIWDFDIHLTLMHPYFAKLHFFDPIIPSFQYSFYPVLHHSILSSEGRAKEDTPALEAPSGGSPRPGPQGPDSLLELR